MLCNRSFKCKYESIQLICRITRIPQFVFLAEYVRCILSWLEQWKHHTKATQVIFISLLDTCTFYQLPLPLPCWEVRKVWKEGTKAASLFLSFTSFSLEIGWNQLTGVKVTPGRGCHRGSLGVCLSSNTIASFYVWSKYWFERKSVACSGFVFPCILNVDVTCTYSHFESCWCIVGSLKS